MEPINVLVMAPAFDESLPQASEEIIRQISGVSPRLRVTDGSGPAMAEFMKQPEGKAALDKVLAEAEIVYGLFLPGDMLARAPKLKWVQTMSAGVDRFASMDIWNSPVTLTGVSGIHATPIGEFVLGFMLMMGGKSQDPNVFNENEIFSFRRITLAPIVVLAGFIFEIWAIMKKPKSPGNND